LVDSTPRTSRRSSVIREESMGFASETSSYEDVMSPLSAYASPAPTTRDLSPTVQQSTQTSQMPIVLINEDESKTSLAQRLKGLVQSVGGASTDETGRLLVVPSSDTEDEEEKAQLTVKIKPPPEQRPSVFQIMQTTRAASVPNVNTVGVDSLMEMVATTSGQASSPERSTNDANASDSRL